MDSVTLFAGQAFPLWVYGLTDSSGGSPQFVTNATVEVTLTDQFGASLGPYTYTYVPGPQPAPDGTVYEDGSYRTVIPPTALIGASSIYLATLSKTINSVTQTEYFQSAAYNCAGYYTSAFAVMAKWGSTNAIIYSNKDDQSTTTINAVAMLQSLLWADDFINNFMHQGPYIVPLSNVGPDVQDIANDLTVYQLYASRGLYDEKADSLGGKLRQAFDQARGRLAAIKGGVFFINAARRWPTNTAPTSAARIAGMGWDVNV